VGEERYSQKIEDPRGMLNILFEIVYRIRETIRGTCTISPSVHLSGINKHILQTDWDSHRVETVGPAKILFQSISSAKRLIKLKLNSDPV
jgi:hypothetical protein